MKSIRTLATVVAVFGLGGYAQAGLLDHLFGHRGGGRCDGCDASKCCDCAPTCEPQCCKPVIIRPQPNVYTYQRQISCLKPPACHDPCCDPCAGVAHCGPAACAPACAPQACCPSAMCPVGERYPCAAAPCAPAQAACCPTGPCCPTGACCPEGCCEYNYAEACEVAQLIYKAQTAPKAKDREKAIDKLGDYDARCYPEIMATLLYSLNDASGEVREEAADEIGDLLDKYPCLCSQCVVDHLTCALADPCKDVRKQAEEALKICGYDIVDACDIDDVCCEVGCIAGYGACAPGCAPGGYSPAAQPAAPMNGEGQAPAPAPPQDTKAYFPRTLPQGAPPARKFSLSRLFSSLN